MKVKYDDINPNFVLYFFPTVSKKYRVQRKDYLDVYKDMELFGKVILFHLSFTSYFRGSDSEQEKKHNQQ